MTSRQQLQRIQTARPTYLLKARQHDVVLGERTLLMSVVNLTPDSFSKGTRLTKRQDPSSYLRLIQKQIAQGADIVDLGAESTRPGALPVSIQEELKRLIPTLTRAVKLVHIPISVDTYKPVVAKAALDAGVSIINNIRGSQLDKSMLKMIARYDAAIVLMHMRGNPRTMQKKVKYKDLLKEIVAELQISVEKCLEMGVKKDRIIIDPGLGFSKTAQQNLDIIKNLSQLHQLKCPLLIGPSRKSFIGQVIHKEAENRLLGTAATVSLGINFGAHIVRVHDVGEMKDVILVTDAILRGDV